jgi:transposase
VRQGAPIAIEVFEGDTGDPSTLGAQIDKIRTRFGLQHVVLVGDRGMITKARIDAELRPAGLDWITALRAGDIKALAQSGALQMSLFDERDMAAITLPEFPGERLIVCRNGELAKLRAHKRGELLTATERDLDKIAKAARRAKTPLGAAKIGVRVGKVINRHKMAKHFECDIKDDSFGFRRKHEEIAREAAQDGVYVVRSPVSAAKLDDARLVGAYKSLSQVERAFRCLKTIYLHLRPIFHWNADRVRAHVFMCMLALYVEHHLRRKLAPILYEETEHEEVAKVRVSIVAKA